jgi:hypothetical protein
MIYRDRRDHVYLIATEITVIISSTNRYNDNNLLQI